MFTPSRFLLTSLLLPLAITAAAQADTAHKPVKKDHWYDKLGLRGYTQIRYNRLLETNKDLKFDQDKSVGDKGGLLLRRGRVVLSGDVHPRVSVYIQTDFAVTPAGSSSLHLVQLRDAYFDLALDSAKTCRLRFGQSKIPFGFENMQSSQNRLPMDRADALNSGVPNERDLGVFFYYATSEARKLYSSLVNDGYKGSGDYGLFGIGIYNGQSANKSELNNNLHGVVRMTYPFRIGSQVFEPGVQAFTGWYTIDSRSAGTKVNTSATYIDQRVAASLVLYPKPFGVLAEYNVGRGPVYQAETDSITTGNVEGGFVTLSYMIRLPQFHQVVFPFARAQYFSGAKKIDIDARRYKVNEYEFGIEYQFCRNFELTASYVISERNTADKANEANNQQGQLLRLQLQFNY